MNTTGSTMRRLVYRARRKICHLLGDRRGVTRWSNVMASHEARDTLRHSFDEGVLPIVNVEISTECNYRCVFCPQSSIRRPVGVMSDEDFGLLISRLKEVRYNGLIVLSVNNEPFMHPGLVQFCRRIAFDLPTSRVVLITNGSLLTGERLRELGSITPTPEITVNDYTADHRVARRIEEFLAGQAGVPMPQVTMQRRSADEALSNRAGNQAGCGTVADDFGDLCCTWPFISLFVAFDLRVFLCCSDYRHEVIVGDLRTTPLMDVWCSKRLREVRRTLLSSGRKNLPLCRNCDADWFKLPEHVR